MAGYVAGDPTAELMELVHDIVRISSSTGDSHKVSACGGGGDLFKKDCTDLVRKISLLTHLLEEIRDSISCSTSPYPPVDKWNSDLTAALQAAKRLLPVASNFDSASSSEGGEKKITFQFRCVTWKLETALGKLPYDQFDVSEEVKEQVALVRAQLKRAADKYGPMNSNLLSRSLSHSGLEDLTPIQLGCAMGTLHIQNIGNVDHEVSASLSLIPQGNASEQCGADHMIEASTSSPASSEVYCKNVDKNALSSSNQEVKRSREDKKSDAISVPDDFLCPISLDIMRDPVIVATGQTYDRSYIQRWIDSGNLTCPKTQQKLQNLTLTPNYVLRSLISQWCSAHDVEQPTGIANGKIKNSDGSFRDITGEIATIEALVRKLSSRSIEDIRTAVTEIRSLSKRSTDNRILIAEAGAIPSLVHLLTSEDVLIQENSVTSILNLSIYENNKGLIMLSGAIPSIVQVLRAGSMEARENAAATLFSLSLGNENKIIIGASGAIPALVDLLQTGSTRGKKDAATALFNLCIYQGNKGRAVRAGIISALLKMLTDSSHFMVDEALTILSVLACCQEAKVAMVKASTIPVLIDLLRTGLPRNKENAAAILLSLCKRDAESLGCMSRLGGMIPLTEIARSGTERAKRKATSLLELLNN
ncbi:hypothetical protein SAY87_013276 [Trapa incisa]|uniref:RING-type E3 ubiquitin transferase n=1 Tax=Trapa incisa TaxID=236973 RepID=A0AAN7KG25_9MYRT|nr:hypothetical protein SAY87_013276 [Trapa incisa]